MRPQPETPQATRTVAVLLTCFNRREKTLNCLQRLQSQILPPNHQIHIFLVDDGCTDGTGDAVRTAFPDVRVIQGTGSLYWAGGMRLAWSTAAQTHPDYFLLLNDDTEIVPDAVSTLLGIAVSPATKIIAVAAIVDPATGAPTYGAQHTGIRPTTDAMGRKTGCNTFNANCILIPKAVHEIIGMLDEAYTHGMADPDYAYRAHASGINIIETAEPLGSCERNEFAGTWKDTSLTRVARWRLINRPTGLPAREWWIYCRRHLGPAAPRIFLGPYLRILLQR